MGSKVLTLLRLRLQECNEVNPLYCFSFTFLDSLRDKGGCLSSEIYLMWMIHDAPGHISLLRVSVRGIQLLASATCMQMFAYVCLCHHMTVTFHTTHIGMAIQALPDGHLSRRFIFRHPLHCCCCTLS